MNQLEPITLRAANRLISLLLVGDDDADFISEATKEVV